MESFKIPKERGTVLLLAPPFPVSVRTVFLADRAETHGGPETVSDLLERPDPFFPVQEEDGEPVFLRKDAVRWVKVENPRETEWIFYRDREAAPSKKIRCLFADGEPLDGTIYAIAPVGEQRVSDLLNRRVHFLHLESEGDLYLVNLRHVVTVRILEEPNGHAG